MKIKETLIHLLGGHTLEEYDDMKKTATEAISGWQSDIDTVDKEIILSAMSGIYKNDLQKQANRDCPFYYEIQDMGKTIPYCRKNDDICQGC